ncbi:hypothetical protein LAUMK191_04476 [Mycobacterium attenuatum]|nr:hypothetical protein LAUMK191_04476 [Mycobacterium attenuatum]
MKQTEIRRRRRTHICVVNERRGSLNREIAKRHGPLVAWVAASATPLACRAPDPRLRGCAHDTAGTTIGRVTEREACATTAHLAGRDQPTR